MQLIDRFISVCRERSTDVAVVYGGERWTYHDIGGLCANVARYLLDDGMATGDRVALVLQNSPQYIAIYYGIWSAGGVTVPLNTQAKSRDIENWLRHSGAKRLFADEDHPEFHKLLTLDVQIIPVTRRRAKSANPSTSVWQSIFKATSTFFALDTRKADLASIIYTSGTTGHPKGVMLSHGNLQVNVDSILSYLKIAHSDSIVNVLPFYYSYGNSILHTHITAGARLVLENSLLFPHRVVECMSAEKVTGFSGVPSTYALILGRVDLKQYDLSSLRYVTQAGGPMPAALVDRLRMVLPDTDLFVMYGQTEATARLTYLEPQKLTSKRGSIGKAIPRVNIEIRDKNDNAVPPGVTGEICASGPNIMMGYWQNSAKTESVLKNGWLYTGDLAHYDGDGYIYIDGRSSDMIKTGGNRISPNEVEEVIQELDGVQEVAVVGMPDEMLGETIKAFVVLTLNSELDKRTIQFHCKNKLTSYKVPKSIEFVHELPKTASGKIKRFDLKSSGDHSDSVDVA